MSHKAHPLTSAGARLERAAMRAYLRRRLRTVVDVLAGEELRTALDFVLRRSARYDVKSGGLGRK